MATHDFGPIDPKLKCPICSQLTIACQGMMCQICIYYDECTDIKDCDHTEFDIIKHLLGIIERYRDERNMA